MIIIFARAILRCLIGFIISTFIAFAVSFGHRWEDLEWVLSIAIWPASAGLFWSLIGAYQEWRAWREEEKYAERWERQNLPTRRL